MILTTLMVLSLPWSEPQITPAPIAPAPTCIEFCEASHD